MQPWQHSRAARLLGPLGFGVSLAVAFPMLCGTGQSDQPGGVRDSIAAGLWYLLTQGPFALAYLLAAIGFGRLLAIGSCRASPHRHYLQAGLGLAAMLTLSHLLGVFGLLSGEGTAPRIAAWATVGVGLALLVDQIIRGSLSPERWPVLPRSAALWGPGVAVLLAAACNPPGWLWGSEFGAYDVLSYHLQLPKEWVTGGRLAPLHHNVYSYLPSYMEAAYAHMAQLAPGSGSTIERMLGGEGGWVTACQLLHAGVGVLASILAARAVMTLAARVAPKAVPAGVIGTTCGLVLLVTPWTLVVSSLAYNEAAVLAFVAGACLAALDAKLGTTARALVCGGLIGAAASAKPTALFIVGPTAGLLLLGLQPVRAWAKSVGLGAAAGVGVMLPWLVRNAMDSGNPVFPFAANRLGAGHWTLEQVDRYARNHHFQGGWIERLARVISDEFGFAHEQFGVLVLLALVGVGITLFARATRRVGVLLLAGVLAGVLAWMTLTHLQSRFLVPLMIPMVLLLGGALAGIPGIGRAGSSAHAGACPPEGCPKRTRAIGIVCVCIAGVAVGVGVLAFMGEGGGKPNRLLPGGVGTLTGMMFEPNLRAMPERERAEAMRALDNPVRFANLELRPHEREDMRIYLLGDGAPLYYLGASAPVSGAGQVMYNTTWDASPLGEAMGQNEDRPDLWTRHLRELGVTHVLINLDELARLAEQDRYFDPRVTLERVLQWTTAPDSGLTRIKDWARTNAKGEAVGGHMLFEVRDAVGARREVRP